MTICEWMKRHGHTQEAVADALSEILCRRVRQSVVSSWVNGAVPSLAYALALEIVSARQVRCTPKDWPGLLPERTP